MAASRDPFEDNQQSFYELTFHNSCTVLCPQTPIPMMVDHFEVLTSKPDWKRIVGIKEWTSEWRKLPSWVDTCGTERFQ